MIDVPALATLRAVSATGSVGGAASALGYTPSAVSQQIKRLERSSGVTLLQKVGRGVVLTEHGRMLVTAGAEILGELERIESRLRSAAGEVSGAVTVIGLSTALCGLVAPAVADLRRYPQLEITVREVEPWPATDQIVSGAADIAIVASWGTDALRLPAGLRCERVLTDHADLLVPSDHRLAGRSSGNTGSGVDVDELTDEPWVATQPNTICRDWLEKMFAGTGKLPRVQHVSAEFSVHIAMVAAANAIALVPRLGRAPLPATVVPVHLKRPSTRDISVVWRATQSESPAVAATVDAIRAAAEVVAPAGAVSASS